MSDLGWLEFLFKVRHISGRRSVVVYSGSCGDRREGRLVFCERNGIILHEHVQDKPILQENPWI